MSRYDSETIRLKYGNMKAAYLHKDYDANGRLVDAWYSCSTKHLGTDFELFMRAVSEQTQQMIEEARAL
jgi:hypothetical protein